MRMPGAFRRLSPQGRTAAGLLAVVVTMASLSFAAVPFYDWFCRTTGFGGVTQVATEAPAKKLERKIRWDPKSETIPGDDEAANMLARRLVARGDSFSTTSSA